MRHSLRRTLIHLVRYATIDLSTMVKSLRKRHLQIWAASAVLIPIGIISAVIVRPQLPKDKLLQPTAAAALPVVLKTFYSRGPYEINVRASADSTQFQLEWFNKQTLTYPTATIYEDTSNTNNISNAVLIGRIEARGTYRFAFSGDLVRNNYHFIIYDFIHQRIIDSITF